VAGKRSQKKQAQGDRPKNPEKSAEITFKQADSSSGFSQQAASRKDSEKNACQVVPKIYSK
jgi:hypothetical protein